MLGLGRYSQHKKLSTKPDQEDFSDDEGCASDDDLSTFRIPREEDCFEVTFLGEETFPGVGSDDNYTNIVKDINKHRFLTMNALSQSKRLSLSINEMGLVVTSPTCKINNDTFNKTFEIPKLSFMSTSIQHKKVLTLICRKCNTLTDVCLYVFICQNEKDPSKILNLCSKRISKGKILLDIKHQLDPDSLRFIYDDNPRPMALNIKEENFTNKNPYTKKETFSPCSNFDLDDEFSQLALKRNERLPDHLQNKTVESACLIQQSGYDAPNKSQSRTNSSNMTNSGSNFSMKSNFFSSSYSRVLSGLK